MPANRANCHAYRRLLPGGPVRSDATLTFMNNAQTCIHWIGQFVYVHDFEMCLDSGADKTFPTKQGRHDANFPHLPALAQSGYVSGHEGEERRSSLGWFEAPIQM
jgi:hypothetical protein